jgi:hypothetical protein|tara:strand:- start:55 stop:429 length:375 start_codon:yes stop_codon:yes gene_type:complete
MTNRSEVVKIIADLIKNGINFDNISVYECNLFMKELAEFVNVSTHLNAHYTGPRISIESVFFEPLLSVELDKTTIQCIPMSDEGWIDAVFEVVKFMHIKEEEERDKRQKKQKQVEQDNRDLDWL